MFIVSVHHASSLVFLLLVELDTKVITLSFSSFQKPIFQKVKFPVFTFTTCLFSIYFQINMSYFSARLASQKKTQRKQE